MTPSELYLGTCIECDTKAKWLRCTQFAGDHPFCKKHAKLEDDFKENSSYTYWIKVNRRQSAK